LDSLVSSKFEFNLNGVPEYSARLRRIRDRASNERTMFRGLIERFKNSERKIFQSEGQALGARWRPLSPEYAAAKDRSYPGQPILVRTGRLRASLVDTPSVRFRGNTMEIGTNVPYSQYHQNGEGRNPRRKHVGLTIGDASAWRRDVARYIVDGRPMGTGE
jgi:phage gpG-like protein